MDRNLGDHRSGLRALILIASLLVAPPVFAGPEDRSDETPVSTSPDRSRPSEQDPVLLEPGRADRLPPLTRAAAQQRIDEMSPLGWLAHFGAVSIGRHE